jgi:hypothetical protein
MKDLTERAKDEPPIGGLQKMLSPLLASGNVCRDRLISAVANGGGHRDWSIMALEQKRASGMA